MKKGTFSHQLLSCISYKVKTKLNNNRQNYNSSIVVTMITTTFTHSRDTDLPSKSIGICKYTIFINLLKKNWLS